MIYAKHDFTKNFINAVGYDDQRMLSDMVIDEIARLIVEDKKDVVKLLRGEGLNVTINDNNQTIGQYLTKEIANGNKKLTEKISHMIATRRIDPVTVIKLNEKAKQEKVKSADTTDGTKTTIWSKIGDFLSNEKVQEAGASIITSVLQNQYNKTLAEQTAANQAALDERLAVNELYSGKTTSGKNTWLIVGIVGGVFLVGTVITIVLLKRKGRSAEPAAPAAS